MNNLEYELKGIDGIRLFGQYWLAEKTARANIVLVHGVGEHSNRYAHVAKAFAEADFNVFTFDQRGHGKSDGKRGYVPSYEILLEDIQVVINDARARTTGALPVILYGHSMGGNEVINFALRKNVPLKGVIATSPALLLTNQSPLKISFGKLMKKILPGMIMKNGLLRAGLSRDQAVIDAYDKDPLVHDLISVSLGIGMYESGAWALEHAKDLKYPLLLMHGSKDQLTDCNGSIKFAELAPKELVKFVLWEGYYHETHNEPEKETVIQTMIDWINQII